MDKQLKQLGSNARVMKIALEQDLKALQLQIENVNGAIEVLDQLETNLGKIAGAKSNGKRPTKTPTKRKPRAANQPTYPELLDRLMKKGKPFTSADFREYCGRYVKNPSKGAMSQALFSKVNTKELKAAGQAKPMKIGKRTIALKLYKAA